MGNQKCISLNQKNQNYKESFLCELQGEENIVSLKFEDGNYEQQIKNSKFLQFLDKYSENRIKLIVTIGNRGVGKSLIQNFIIQKYQNRSEYFQIFKSQFNDGNCTKGIKFYFPQNLKEPKNQKEDIVLFFDCEGFDFSDKTSPQQQNLIKLICLISRLSTCLIYVQTTNRIQKGFEEIIKTLNENSSTNNCPHENFISILNYWNGVNFQSSSPFFKKQFKLRSLDLNQNNEIIVNQNYDQFIQEINDIKNYCVQSKYTTSQSNCKAFEREQTCNSFKEMLICVFQIIEKEMNFTSEQHFQLINKQLELKQEHAKSMNAIREFMKQNYESQVKTLEKNEGSSYKSEIVYCLFNLGFQNYYSQKVRIEFDKAYQNWRNQFQQAFKTMLQISTEKQGKVLNDNEQNEILELYSNLDSVKPQEIRDYERQINNYTVNQDIEIIKNKMVGYRALFFSFGFAFASLTTILQGMNYMVKIKIKNSLSNRIEKALFSSINQNKFVLNSSINNLREIKNILTSEIPKFNEYIQFINSQQEKEAVCLLLLMNCISKAFDQKSLEKQKTTSYQIDIQLFQCADFLAKQLKLNNFTNFENLQYLAHQIDAIISESQQLRG
ncbi:kelch motif protein (macronuclear) [Tetrahymena thermophila SB210]|uniref:Kelch motif protein n=1 Tax=Tetrahymena thermophila (strain SB210) TaxID=312017 RepID=Q22KW3_TETTS|nr:kelch motif protein [Tetrahymena thermophila SB210]EAR85915.2 kelch motif protein [Tetrahymena thermophila SB210]|eukprot:XP_976510.2 kelch motif protein [Tetrahymena thermophila SB210]